MRAKTHLIQGVECDGSTRRAGYCVERFDSYTSHQSERTNMDEAQTVGTFCKQNSTSLSLYGNAQDNSNDCSKLELGRIEKQVRMCVGLLTRDVPRQ